MVGMLVGAGRKHDVQDGSVPLVRFIADIRAGVLSKE